jgi:starch synthase
MKTALQRRFGLATQRDSRLISFVGRLAEQKGLHLLSGWAKDEGVSVLESILLREPQTQIIVAGPQTPNDSSVEELEGLMRWLQHKFANRVVFIRDFISHALALEIIFGSDLFLMPSRFEPGGITQLEALAAGTLVVGRNVGGIGATIENIDVEKESGTGFLCDDYSCGGFRDTLLWALDTLKNEELRVKLIDNARFANHDWSDRVPKYRALFQHICVDGELLRDAPWHDDHVKILQQILP